MEKDVSDFKRYHHSFGHHSPVSRIIAMTIGGVVVSSIFALVFSWLVMFLWNWLMPSIFNLKTITYWQGFGIILLAKLLFGGIHHGCRKHHSRFMHHPRFHHGGSADEDEFVPCGDFRNWKHYRQYWKERGKMDFENYLNEIRNSNGNDNNNNEPR